MTPRRRWRIRLDDDVEFGVSRLAAEFHNTALSATVNRHGQPVRQTCGLRV